MKKIKIAVVVFATLLTGYYCFAGLSAGDKKALNTIERNMATKGFLLGDIIDDTLTADLATKADTDLANLTSTLINTSLVSRTASTWIVKSEDHTDSISPGVDTKDVILQTGHQLESSAAETGFIIIRSGEMRDTSVGPSGRVTVTSGDVDNGASSGATGDLRLRTGTQAGSGVSGDIDVTVGSTTTGNAGRIDIGGGDSSGGGDGTDIAIISGDSTGGFPGFLDLTTGVNSLGGGISGPMTLKTGDADNSGIIDISSGNGLVSGDVRLNVGSGSSTRGNIRLNGATVIIERSASASPIRVTSPDLSAAVVSQRVRVQSGDMTGTASVASGSAFFRSGDSIETSTGGTGDSGVRSGEIFNAANASATGIMSNRSGNTAGLGASGLSTTRSGDLTNASNTADSGIVEIRSGDTAGSGDSGDVSLQTGTSGSGARGKVSVNANLMDVLSGAAFVKVIADPCGDTVAFPEATLFYNNTSDYYCFCDGSNVDQQMHAPTTACF